MLNRNLSKTGLTLLRNDRFLVFSSNEFLCGTTWYNFKFCTCFWVVWISVQLKVHHHAVDRFEIRISITMASRLYESHPTNVSYLIITLSDSSVCMSCLNMFLVVFIVAAAAAAFHVIVKLSVWLVTDIQGRVWILAEVWILSNLIFSCIS